MGGRAGGSLAAEEYLRGDDGMGGGGPTNRTSGISVTHGFGWWMKRLLFQIYTASSRPPLLFLILCFGTSPRPHPIFFKRAQTTTLAQR